MARRDDDYKFLQIADAIASINQRVNLIGVVTESGLPKQSKGTDCCVSIRIIDESRPSHGLSVNFFAETMDKLPQVMADGDIVQLSQVVMKTYGPDAVNASYNKKFSSFALYEGKHGTSFTPYQCSNKFHAREQDNKFILGLRKWLTGEHCDAGAKATTFITRPADLLQLKDLREGIHFNLVCKILHARETKRDGWMLFVWDGTDTPPLPIHNNCFGEEELTKPSIPNITHLEGGSVKDGMFTIFALLWIGRIRRVVVIAHVIVIDFAP
ncbi:unnamed protein product [Cuscuta campestris]|uniref:Telomeric single stranded DNA binding POT1/Cdc13 domain-containing protein n=1 Tax=Cuscuta campestris TaxID=132261 RepID=A0A484LXN2_9ASTE|nr:unnamed protein product [Cuscuta campestris]